MGVWLYKNQAFDDDFTRQDVIRSIIDDFDLRPEEIESLFSTEVESGISDGLAFSSRAIDWPAFLDSVSRPPDVPLERSGILTYLEAAGVGPIPNLRFDPKERLNLLTGDNGLGKTFLLDLAWWALTDDWAERPALPFQVSPSEPPSISYSVESRGITRPITATYSYGHAEWVTEESKPTLSGLVVYARLDGSFAIWDPANLSLGHSVGQGPGWPGLKFNRDDIWDGKGHIIEGLIRDWVRWQTRSPKSFEVFTAVLDRVYPPDIGQLRIGDPIRIAKDSRDIPTLIHPYGTVPIVYESAGIRRILTLAYLLVWVLEEHQVHATQQGLYPEHQMVVLIDEIEAHLHPKWQRAILPALLQVSNSLHREMEIQWIVASHSPLILASAEESWDSESDQLFHLAMAEDGHVSFDAIEFFKRGTIDSWLSSELFEISQPGSTARENAIWQAIDLQSHTNPSQGAIIEATEQLKKHLSDEDPFWIRWIFFAQSFGVDL